MKYQLTVMESERGWGQEYWKEVYDTYEEAVTRAHEINSANLSEHAPDWYMRALDIKSISDREAEELNKNK